MMHNSNHSRRRFQGSSLDTIGVLADNTGSAIQRYNHSQDKLNRAEDSSTSMSPRFRGYLDLSMISQFYDLR